MTRHAIHRRGQTEKQPSSIICFYLCLHQWLRASGAAAIVRLPMSWGEEQTVLNGLNRAPGTSSGIMAEPHADTLVSVCLLVPTCVRRSLSAPAGGFSSWPCIRPPSAFGPPQCRSVWAAVCTCSQGSAPDAACWASPAPHNRAVSPG